MEVWEEEMMKEVINASEISLGQQRSYVGLATQQETVARNDMGTATYVDGFMQYYAGLCQFGLNYAKVLYMDNEGAEEAQTVLSDDAIKLFKNTTEFQLEDMMIRVDIDDIIDEGARKRLLDIALAMAQNVQVSGFDFDDYLDIYLETGDYLEKDFLIAKDYVFGNYSATSFKEFKKGWVYSDFIYIPSPSESSEISESISDTDPDTKYISNFFEKVYSVIMKPEFMLGLVIGNIIERIF